MSYNIQCPSSSHYNTERSVYGPRRQSGFSETQKWISLYYIITIITTNTIIIISIGILLYPQRRVPRAIRSQMLVCDGHTSWKVNMVVVVAYTYYNVHTYMEV